MNLTTIVSLFLLRYCFPRNRPINGVPKLDYPVSESDCTVSKLDYTVSKLDYPVSESDCTVSKLDYTVSKLDFTYFKLDCTVS